MRQVIRVILAAAIAIAAMYAPSTPTPLEVQFHGGCNSIVTYVECLAGGRQDSPGSQFLAVERHRTYAGLTPDDIHEIKADHIHYLCDKPALCAS